MTTVNSPTLLGPADLATLKVLLEEAGHSVQTTGKANTPSSRIIVTTGVKWIRVKAAYGIFLATGVIPGVPTSFFGDGAYEYQILI